MDNTKSLSISKQMVWKAFKRVKANQGAARVDGQSIAKFEEDLENNLYKLWNRLASGSYFPPPVLRVEIPKEGGKTRPLGIPTVADRIAQMVVKVSLEPELERHFHADSYGYRPEKSAIQAVAATRRRCWRYDWVIDIDIKGFFDNLNWKLLMKAVRKHSSRKWEVLYVERWLKAPIQRRDGSLINQEKGTPQGGVASPLLANLFLHYAFDEWMKRNFPDLPFARYADDIVAHCGTYQEAKEVMGAIRTRLSECDLELHPNKTKIAYCKDDKRKQTFPTQSFDFLGFTFRPRSVKAKEGKAFVGFTPAVSGKAAKKMRETMRQWKHSKWSKYTLEDIAELTNPVVRGWINYYGNFHKSALYPILNHQNIILANWVMRKYKRYKNKPFKAGGLLRRISKENPNLFAHWRFGAVPGAGFKSRGLRTVP